MEAKFKAQDEADMKKKEAKKEKDTEKKKNGGGLFGRISSIFKGEKEKFHECQLGHEGNVRWNPVTKQYEFPQQSGSEEEDQEEPAMPPPTAKSKGF